MRSILLIYIIILLGATGSRAQTLSGNVVDGATGKPLFFVTVVDLNTEQSAATDEHGRFVIAAKTGDIISYSYVGYHTIERIATAGVVIHIELLPLTIQLQEYILHPDYTPFQKDSAEMAALYSKELNTQRIKPKVDLNNGVEVSGLIGSAVQKMSKSYKKNKKFKETFKKDQEQKYIDSRYTPQLVTAITGFTGDTLVTFMNTYPLEYAYARAATDLELKMWIRDNYKDYLHKRTQ